MATASPQAWLEEELICSVCLQIYTDPVILNCKHSFCRDCIEKTWDEAVFDAYPCPECRAEYRKRPQLLKNFKLESIIQKYNAQDTSNCSLPCSYCTSNPRPAVKTCLKCEALLCLDHLRHHTRSTVFTKHILVDPTADVSRWKCTEHHELLKIYCKDDKVCVCTLCTLIGKHNHHRCGSISEGEKELRDEIKQKKFKIKEKSDALRKRIESEEREIFEYLDREEKRVIAEIDAQIRNLNSKVRDFRKDLNNLNSISKKKEIIFIQMFNSVSGNNLSKPFSLLPPPSLDATKLREMAHWLQERVERNRDVTILLYGLTPILDPDTANPQLAVSYSRRSVVLTKQKRRYPDHLERFDCFPQVLCAEGVSCGRSYWEVEVQGGCWRVGVCYRSLSRKGPGAKCSLGMNDKSWSVCSVLGSCTALYNGNKTKITAENHSRVGVYVDIEAGIISFYSVSDRKLTLLHSFQQQTFTEPLYPALTVNECDACITMCALSLTLS
ncbi:E3 ubiquitin/ISG15 ligase TRIM25-like isoform X2 [Heterodontus francisci]|uniref:E3 ubiquitin/ISG15 ligase TRIM25-like isoform X2 n=1 Tax=Heterodontus francisci TaxID=7792 RepID=UPI00355B46EE